MRREAFLTKKLRSQGWRAASGGFAKQLWDSVLYRRFHEIPMLCQVATGSNRNPIELVEKTAALAYQFGYHDDLGKLAASYSPESDAIACLAADTEQAPTVAQQILYGDFHESGPIRSLWISATTENSGTGSSGDDAAIPANLYGEVDWPLLTSESILLEVFAVRDVTSLLRTASPAVCAKTAFARFIIEAHEGGLSEACVALIGDGLFDVTPPEQWRMAVAAIARRQAIPLSVALAAEPTAFPPRNYRVGEDILTLTERGADLVELNAALTGGARLVTAPVNHADLSRIPAEARPTQPTQLIEHYSDDESALADRAAALANEALQAWQDAFSRATPEYADWSTYLESMYVRLFMVIYQIEMNRACIDTLLNQKESFSRLLLILKDGELILPYTSTLVRLWSAETTVISVTAVDPARVPDVLDRLSAAAKGADIDAPDPVTSTANDWSGALTTWMNEISDARQDPSPGAPRRWVAAFFQQINGYLESYKGLLAETLNHADVEVATSAANHVLNRLIDSGSITNGDGRHVASRLIVPAGGPSPSKWLAPLVDAVCAEIYVLTQTSASGLRHEHLHEIRSVFRRTPMVLQTAAYFLDRFAARPPEHILTAPNQHIEARIASHVGRKLNIPVYETLILAVTNHPRYRSPICDRVFIYDPWYTDLYKDYFGIPEEHIIVSGPLFDYAGKIRANDKTNMESGLIVFFSQNAYLNLCLRVVEGIFQTIKAGRNLRLIIKLHPHESPVNASVYMAAAKRFGCDAATEVIVSGDHLDLIGRADVVVQAFSNVGLDAYLMGKPVITARFSQPGRTRLFLHEKGIGLEVFNETELAGQLHRLLYDDEAKRALVLQANGFAEENRHFFAVDNARATVSRMFELDLSLRESRA